MAKILLELNSKFLIHDLKKIKAFLHIHPES